MATSSLDASNDASLVAHSIAEALSPAAWQWFSIGLGTAFVVTIGMIVLFLFNADSKYGIDQGFLGLILLLVTIFYMISFSFLVAASTKGLDIKFIVAAVDALVLFGSKLLAPDFLKYLNDEKIGSPTIQKRSSGEN